MRSRAKTILKIKIKRNYMKTLQDELPQVRSVMTWGGFVLIAFLMTTGTSGAFDWDRAKRDLEKKVEDRKREFDRGLEEQKRKLEQQRREYQRTLDQKTRQTQQNWERSLRQTQNQINQGSSQLRRNVERSQRDLQRQATALRHEAQRLGKQYGYQVQREVEMAQRRFGNQTAAELSRAYSQYGPQIGRQVQNSLDIYYRNSARWASNPQNQQKAVNAIVQTAVVYNRFDSKKKRITKQAITRAGEHIMVQDHRGRSVNLNQFSKDYISQNAPFLAGTSIAEDPAEALTYGIIYGDTNYIFNDMKVMPSRNGEFHSVRDAAIMNAGLDAGQTLAALEMADNIQTLGDGEASPEDLVAAANAIQAIQTAR